LTAEEFIERILVGCLRVKHLIVGDDFCFGARRSGDFALLQQSRRPLRFPRRCHGQRHARRRTRIQFGRSRRAPGGRMEHAARLLGRPYSIDGRVVHGEKLGRQFGFATANIRIKHDKPPLPASSPSKSRLPGGPHRGVANLGTARAPTR
jgi:riboflavin kinase/FMN adenylyltransferase